ncbi:small acid-soluble spore protein P [Paenibacillus sp. HB172176]|uniref:small acid-soluble spore protein P n=1 Tax=Paenibacillus sp. HB172176 TaxID=2493690 RepID=UPI00143999CE|nr:small acid-soluble spore protein P [Paenibacillus sp. HB172176]
MSKPKSMPVPESVPHNERKRRDHDGGQQAPLSGSKKTKQRNHVDHHNTEG